MDIFIEEMFVRPRLSNYNEYMCEKFVSIILVTVMMVLNMSQMEPNVEIMYVNLDDKKGIANLLISHDVQPLSNCSIFSDKINGLVCNTDDSEPMHYL